MKMLNLGCGPDTKDGWINSDQFNFSGDVICWNATRKVPKSIGGDYDFVLVNHVLCTMNHADVDKVLDNILDILKPGGKVQIIDLDLLMAFAFYEQGAEDMIPASGDSLDEKFVNHLSGFGTRKSLYTPPFMTELLQRHGFRNITQLAMSEHDLRPNESIIFEAMK